MHDSEQVAALLVRTVSAYESGQPRPWMNPLSQEANQKMVAAVVGFSMVIDSLEGKFKLGQNRKPEDQLGAIEGLEKSEDSDSIALARFARSQLGLPPAK